MTGECRETTSLQLGKQCHSYKSENTRKINAVCNGKLRRRGMTAAVFRNASANSKFMYCFATRVRVTSGPWGSPDCISSIMDKRSSMIDNLSCVIRRGQMSWMDLAMESRRLQAKKLISWTKNKGGNSTIHGQAVELTQLSSLLGERSRALHVRNCQGGSNLFAANEKRPKAAFGSLKVDV